MSFLSKKTYRIVTKPGTANVWLVLVFVFFLGTSAFWVSLDHSPGYWDDAWYLTNSLVLYDTLIDHGPIAYWKKFLDVLEFKAPLIAVLPTPLYRLFGRHSRVAHGVNLVFMALLFGAVYRLARRYSSPRAGLVALFFTATLPLLYGLSRQYLVEYGLTALVATTVCCLVESQGLRDARKACCLGALCGLGLMMKITFPLYVFLPFFFVAIRTFAPAPIGASPSNAHPRPTRSSVLMCLLAFVAPLALITLPWYGRNWRKTFDHAFRSGFSPMADQYGMGDPFSLVVVWRYLTHWVNDGISGAYVLLLMALAGTALWYEIRMRRPVLPSEGRNLVLLWFLPFLVFLFGRNKDIRFTAPLLPAVAITLAWMADSVFSSLKRWGTLALVLLLSVPLAAYLHTSFGLLGDTRLAWGDLVLLAPRLSHAGPPDRKPWPHKQILEILRSHSESGGRRTVMLGSDTPHFNANNFELAATDGLYSFETSTSAYEDDLPSLLNAANSKMFFVYKEGGEQESRLTDRFFTALVEDVKHSGKFFSISRYPDFTQLPTLPDGGKLVVYQNHWPNSPIVETQFYLDGVDRDGVELPAINVNFGNVIKLTGLAFGIQNQCLKVIYRWRSLGKLDQELLCFTHILDGRRKVVGFLDHAILGDTNLAKAQGWTANESLRYRLPEGIDEVHLRLGLFLQASGERLAIRVSNAEQMTLSLTDGGTAVVASGMTRSLPRLPASRLE